MKIKKQTILDTQNIPLEKIEIADRLREVDPEGVMNLAASMGGEKGDKINIIQPIIVIAAAFGGYRLVAGAHRVAAAQQLGWKDISAIVVEGLTADDVRVLEIDENLHRRELSPGEYAEFATMKIRLSLKRDGRNTLPDITDLEDDAEIAKHYVKTAGIAGVHPETIALAVRRRRQLDHVWDRLKGTSAMNSGAALDRLRKKFNTNAGEIIDAAVEHHGGDIEAAMDAIANPRAQKTSVPAEVALKELRKAWKICPPAKKQKFVDDNADEIIGFLKNSGCL